MQGQFINDRQVLLTAAEEAGVEGAQQLLDNENELKSEVCCPKLFMVFLMQAVLAGSGMVPSFFMSDMSTYKRCQHFAFSASCQHMNSFHSS